MSFNVFLNISTTPWCFQTYLGNKSKQKKTQTSMLAIRLKQKLITKGEGGKHRVYISEVKEQADRTFSWRGIHPAFTLAWSQASTSNGSLSMAVASYKQVSFTVSIAPLGWELLWGESLGEVLMSAFSKLLQKPLADWGFLPPLVWMSK